MQYIHTVEPPRPSTGKKRETIPVYIYINS